MQQPESAPVRGGGLALLAASLLCVASAGAALLWAPRQPPAQMVSAGLAVLALLPLLLLALKLRAQARWSQLQALHSQAQQEENERNQQAI